jgi:hypothetical protein
MRRIILTIGILAMTGCAGSSASRQERHQRAVQSFKDWMWKTRDSSFPQSASDKDKAHHEQTTVRTLNHWIGNQPD